MEAKILTCADINVAKEAVLSGIDSKLTKVFECDEFKVDDAKAVMKEAYICEESTKHLVIVASSYRIEAQNALLKLLEEPPRNIVFILISKSKTAFLPTIRSRMHVEKITYNSERRALEINIKKMELSDIFNFLKNNKNIAKGELKEIIEEILKMALIDAKISLNRSELALFDKALTLAELNTRAQTILSTLLLMLYHARARSQS